MAIQKIKMRMLFVSSGREMSNLNNIFSLCLLPLIFLMIAGCSEKRIAYNKSAYKEKIIAGYTVTLNNNLINPAFYFLDKKNIDKIVVDDKTNNISITQKNNDAAVFTSINDAAINRDTIKMLVVNGIPFQKQYIDSVVIETSAIKKISILQYDPKSTVHNYNSPVWIIVTK